MKYFKKSLILGLTGYLFMAPVVLAAPLNGDNETLVSQTIRAGALTIQAPFDVMMSEIAVSTQVESTSGMAEDLFVDDARGNQTPVGWSAVATMTNFSGLADPEDATSTVTIPFFDAETGQNDYKLTPQNLVEYNGAAPGVVLGTAEELTESATAGLSNPKTIMTAPAGEGQGRYGTDIQIDLQVPANSAAADYTSTMTFTVS